MCKRRGFIFPSSEIYGGLAGVWDLGPLGALLQRNIRNLWFENFVGSRPDVYFMEGTILMNPRVWQASGHITEFTDPLAECKKCHKRFRADHLEEGKFVGQGKAKKKEQCPDCGGKEFTDSRNFNLMFKTFAGPTEDSAHQTYLRPETAQTMFVNFKNVYSTQRAKLPFGIAQIGKCFRNEINTGDYIFRSREFNIAELEYFVKPGNDEKWFEKWKDDWMNFFLSLGIKKENLRFSETPKEELAHYSKRTVDIEYKFPFGWSELAGIANRTDFDLKKHSEVSGEDLSYISPQTKEKFYPFVIEPTLGLERTLMAVMFDAFREVEGGRTKTTESKKETETVLSLLPKISPVKAAVFPIVKNKEEITQKALEVFNNLKSDIETRYDQSGAIGRRYRRADEAGIPFAITTDFQTIEDETVTVRDRETMAQKRVKIGELKDYIAEKIK